MALHLAAVEKPVFSGPIKRRCAILCACRQNSASTICSVSIEARSTRYSACGKLYPPTLDIAVIFIPVHQI